MVWDLSTPLYFRPESGGVLVSLCEEIPSQPGDESCDDHLAERLASGMHGLRPPLDDAQLVRGWACQRTMTPDDRFVVGPDPRLEGFFWVAGFGGHGMSAGLAAGRVAADLIVGEHPPRLTCCCPRVFSRHRLRERVGKRGAAGAGSRLAGRENVRVSVLVGVARKACRESHTPATLPRRYFPTTSSTARWRNVGRAGTDHDVELAGLHDLVHLPVVEREIRGPQLEAHRLRLARLEADAREAARDSFTGGVTEATWL